MSADSCVLLSSQDSRTSCIFQTADEKDDVPGVGDESVLEMLSYSKFSDLETWLCMPSSLLLSRTQDSTYTSYTSSSSGSSNHSSSSSSSLACKSRYSSCSDSGETDTTLRSSERESTFFTPSLGKEMSFLASPLFPILTSTPAAAPSSGTSAADSLSHSGVRKRRRLAASPGGLHWNSAGSVQRDLWSPDLRGRNPAAGGRGVRSLPLARGRAVWASERAVLRKTVSVDEWLLQAASGERAHLRLLGRLERGRKKLHSVHGLGTTGRYDSRKKCDWSDFRYDTALMRRSVCEQW